MVANRRSMHAMSARITFICLCCMVMVLILWPLPFAGQFFRDGVSIDVDAQFLRVPGHPPVPVERWDLWKFMSRKLVGDCQCWASAYSSSQGAGIVAGAYKDYIVDGLLATAGQLYLDCHC